MLPSVLGQLCRQPRPHQTGPSDHDSESRLTRRPSLRGAGPPVCSRSDCGHALCVVGAPQAEVHHTRRTSVKLGGPPKANNGAEAKETKEAAAEVEAEAAAEDNADAAADAADIDIAVGGDEAPEKDAEAPAPAPAEAEDAAPAEEPAAEAKDDAEG